MPRKDDERDVGTAAALNCTRSIHLERSAKEAYNVWAWSAGVSTPWERLEPRQSSAWRDLMVYVQATSKCSHCGAGLECASCRVMRELHAVGDRYNWAK
jgi:hypothetical protein